MVSNFIICFFSAVTERIRIISVGQPTNVTYHSNSFFALNHSWVKVHLIGVNYYITLTSFVEYLTLPNLHS